MSIQEREELTPLYMRYGTGLKGSSCEPMPGRKKEGTWYKI